MAAVILSQEQARGTASDWIRAWNARDLEGILAHYADDIHFSSPTVITRLGEPSGVLVGKQRLREHFATGLQAFGATVSFELRDVLTGVNGYTVYYRRENGATVVDTVIVNGQGKAVQVHAHYALPQ